MKKLLLLVTLLLSSGNIYSQKKKVSSKPSTMVLAKTELLTAELIKNNFCFINNKNTEKDTVFIKKTNPKSIPLEVKIKSFTTKGTTLYCITWLEKNNTKTDLKTEELTTIFTEIWQISSDVKTQLVENKQITTKITEKVFLDKLKNASETQEKIRREGYELTLTAAGDVLLKNKSQETKMTYNPAEKKYTNSSVVSVVKKKK